MNKYLYFNLILFVCVESFTSVDQIKTFCNDKIFIDGCINVQSLRIYSYVPNKIKLFFESPECTRKNFSYSWKITDNEFNSLISKVTKVPVWKFNLQRLSNYKSRGNFTNTNNTIFVTLKNQDNRNEELINIHCGIQIIQEPQQDFSFSKNQFIKYRHTCNFSTSTLTALISYVDIFCNQENWPLIPMIYRIEQYLDDVFIPLSETNYPSTRIKLITNLNSPWIFISFLKPDNSIERISFTINVSSFTSHYSNYEEIIKIISRIIANDDPFVTSPHILFRLELYEESVVIMHGILREVILYKPKNNEEDELKEEHLYELAGEFIDLLIKFEDKSGLFSRIGIIQSLISISSDLNYRFKLSNFCTKLVKLLLQDSLLFTKGVNNERDFIPEDINNAYDHIKSCIHFVTFNPENSQDSQFEINTPNYFQRFHFHPIAHFEHKKSPSDSEYKKLIRIHSNNRNIIFQMSSLRIKECFFCNIDDEFSSGHLFYYNQSKSYIQDNVVLKTITFNSKYISYTLPSHRINYSLYGSLVNLIWPVQPSEFYLNGNLESFLLTPIITIYGIMVNYDVGIERVLKINDGKIDVMFHREYNQNGLNINRRKVNFLETSYFGKRLNIKSFAGKMTCIEFYDVTKSFSIITNFKNNRKNINLPEIERDVYCFPIGLKDENLYFIIEHETKRLKTRQISEIEENLLFKNNTIAYSSYFLSCARLVKGSWITDETLNITEDNKLKCTGNTIEDVAILATPLQIKLTYLNHPIYDLRLGRVYNPSFVPKINLLLYIPVLVAVALYCLLWIILLHRSLHPQAIYFLSDNHKDERHAYLLEVTTGKEINSGTTSNVMIKVFGSSGISRAHVLNYPDPDLRLLRHNNQDYFIMTTKTHLGELFFIQLWIDFISLEPKWKCDKIRICDLQTKHWWTFNVNSWLTVDKLNSSCIRTLSSITNFKNTSIYKSFLPFFDSQHTWNFLSSHSRFYTCAEKLTIMLSQIVWICSITIIICRNPQLNYSDSRELENVNVGYVAFTTLQVSLIAYFANVPFILMFRLSNLTRNELYVHELNIFSRGARFITWFLLSIGIIANILTVFVFSLYISYDTSLIIYGLIILSILWIVFVWEYLFIMMVKIVNYSKSDENNKWYFYNRIISEGEEQRAMISRMFSNVSNLRPYLLHLYKPLGVDVITIKRHMILRITSIKNCFLYVIFQIICVCLLHLIATSNMDSLTPVHNEHLKSLMIGETPIKTLNKTNLLNLSNLESVPNYINDILLKTLQSKMWYGQYQVSDYHLTSDFQTKYIGNPSLRLKIVKGTKPFNTNFSKTIGLKKIYPEFTTSLENKNRSDLSDEWFYYNSKKSHHRTFNGELNKYPGGGFMTFLNPDKENTTKKKEKEWWLKMSTKAIFIEFFTYNNNINLFSDVKIVIERSSTGLMVSSVNIISNRLNYKPEKLLLMRISVYLLIIIIFIHFIVTLRNIIDSKLIWKHVKIFDFIIIFSGIGAFVLYELKSYYMENFFLKIKTDLSQNITDFQDFYLMECYRIIMGILIWILIIGIIFYLKFVTTDVIVYKLLFSQEFFCLVLIYIIFATTFSIISHVLYNYSKDFYSNSLTLKNILILNHLRKTNTYEIMSYSKTLPFYTFFYSLFLFTILALFIAHFNTNYIKEKHLARFYLFYNYSIWDYIIDKTIFYTRYTFYRLRELKMAGGGSSLCKKLYFRANNHRFCGSFLTRESRLEAIRHIAFGYLYIKFLRENRPLNHADVIVMLGIAESYMKRNETVELVYYKDCRPGKRHYMTGRRMALMEIVVDRVFQDMGEEKEGKEIEKRKESEERKTLGAFDESITDIRTLKRLDDLIFQLVVLNETLERLVDFEEGGLLK